jgi:hypothetical protein
LFLSDELDINFFYKFLKTETKLFELNSNFKLNSALKLFKIYYELLNIRTTHGKKI